MPVSAMILVIFRWAVAQDQGQRNLPAAFVGAERSAWTSSRARSSSGGTGTSRQRSVRRFRVRTRIEAALRSTSLAHVGPSATCRILQLFTIAALFSRHRRRWHYRGVNFLPVPDADFTPVSSGFGSGGRPGSVPDPGVDFRGTDLMKCRRTGISLPRSTPTLIQHWRHSRRKERRPWSFW